MQAGPRTFRRLPTPDVASGHRIAPPIFLGLFLVPPGMRCGNHPERSRANGPDQLIFAVRLQRLRLAIYSAVSADRLPISREGGCRPETRRLASHRTLWAARAREFPPYRSDGCKSRMCRQTRDTCHHVKWLGPRPVSRRGLLSIAALSGPANSICSVPHGTRRLVQRLAAPSFRQVLPTSAASVPASLELAVLQN